MLADCCVLWHQEWGSMAAVRWWQPPWSICKFACCRNHVLPLFFLLFCHCRCHSSFPNDVAARTTRCDTQPYICIDKEGSHAHNWNPARWPKLLYPYYRVVQQFYVRLCTSLYLLQARAGRRPDTVCCSHHCWLIGWSSRSPKNSPKETDKRNSKNKHMIFPWTSSIFFNSLPYSLQQG